MTGMPAKLARPERDPSQSERRPDGDGPFLIVAAFWLATDETDAVADALRESDFPTPGDWPRGAVVAFRREIATRADFKLDLRRLDLAELTETPE